MSITKKNMVTAKVKRLYEIRSLLNELKKEEKALKSAISEYMQEQGIESFETASCNIKFRHVPKLTLDETLGLNEEDLISLSMRNGWLDCVMLNLNERAYHEHSKSVNNGESVFIESERLDLIFTFKR